MRGSVPNLDDKTVLIEREMLPLMLSGEDAERCPWAAIGVRCRTVRTLGVVDGVEVANLRVRHVPEDRLAPWGSPSAHRFA